MTSDIVGGKRRHPKGSPGKVKVSPASPGVRNKSPVPRSRQTGGSLAVATVPAALFVLKVLLEKLKNPKKASDTVASAPRRLSVRRSAPVSPRKSPRASPAPSVRRKLKRRLWFITY